MSARDDLIPLTLTFTGRARGDGSVPLSVYFDGGRGDSPSVNAFDLVERAVLRALCEQVIGLLDVQEGKA